MALATAIKMKFAPVWLIMEDGGVDRTVTDLGHNQFGQMTDFPLKFLNF